MAFDYFTVQPHKVKLLNKHFTKGRGGAKIEFITRHHNGGVTTTEQTWNTWQTRRASAHYQIETDGTVGQLVWDQNTAWANANTWANQRTIAIEHSNNGGEAQDWPISTATIEAGAKWAAALCWYYKLGRPNYGTNIRDHNNFSATGCPWHLGKTHNGREGKYHAQWMRTAQAHYDWMVAGGKTDPNKGAPVSQNPQLDRVHHELTERFQSRVEGSQYRDTLVGYALNTDAAAYRTELMVAEVLDRLDRIEQRLEDQK